MSDALNPVETAAYNPPGFVRDMISQGGNGYLSDTDNGLRILKTSDPTDLTRIGLYTGTDFLEVVISGDYAYALELFKLHILDIAVTNAVTEVGSLPLPGGGDQFKIDGQHAFIALTGEGMRVIDVSDPANPLEVGAFTGGAPIGINDLAISGTLAFLADGSYGLRIVDISDPTQPDEIGAYDIGQPWVYHVEVNGSLAYVFAEQILYVIDVSNPVSPSLIISQTVTDRYIEDTFLLDNQIYLAERFESGLRILDQATPLTPTEVFSTSMAGRWTWDVYVDKGLIYIANGNAGLYVWGDPSSLNKPLYLPIVVRGE